MLFEAEFRREIDRQLEEKKNGTADSSPAGGLGSIPAPERPTRWTIEGDDAN